MIQGELKKVSPAAACVGIVILTGLVGVPLALHVSAVSACQIDNVAPQLQDDPANLSLAEQLKRDQERLAASYQLLEEKLFSLYEYEQDANPIRSKLLQRAFLQSQEQMTAEEMRIIVQLLNKAKLKDAEVEQEEVLVELAQLLQLLQSEDRGKRVRDEIQRHQEYLDEVERILRIQKGIRGQTEGGVDQTRLARTQEKTAERADRLADQIAENEESASGATEEDAGQSKPEDKPSDSPAAPSANPNGQPAAPPGSGDTGQPAGPDQHSEENPVPENPVRKRIQAAEERMRNAQERLDQAERENALEEMKQAERELALAKKELEEILRQLREEEIERTLAMLEGRFRQMLERQVRVHGATLKLGQIPFDQRVPDFSIQAGRLAVEQNEIGTAASRALMLLREDGSSVAFPATVADMHEDMLQVASRLSAAKVGSTTQEIEKDIIETLDYLIKALVKTQQDMERMKKSPPGNSGAPGDKPLVDQLAEIKMLRGLQERIHKRHLRYARLLDNPDDPLGATEDPEMRAALDRLAGRQAELTDIARDIVNGKNQ
jgi:hypothetical protein